MEENLMSILEEAMNEYYKELPPEVIESIKERFIWMLLSR